jgi:putative ABC transport system permease protein
MACCAGATGLAVEVQLDRRRIVDIKPIVTALRRHRAGTMLIVLQIALTLAIVCNALFIIQECVERMSRPTGLVEDNLLTVQNLWVGTSGEDVAPLIRADLDNLRKLPGVQDAMFVNSFPLRGGGWSSGARLDPAAEHWLVQTAMYGSDEHALSTLGVRLVAGRNFRPEEIASGDDKTLPVPPVVIITQALADRLFPDGSALGKTIYLSLKAGAPPSTIVGIVDRLQAPWPGPFADTWTQNATLLPARLTNRYGYYLVRAQPGQLATLFHSVPAALMKLHSQRVIPPLHGVRSFAEVREQAYKTDRGMAVVMGVVCAALLGITGAGIVGLTSFWVGQRRNQIGVRRALGATRRDILVYFLTENLLISGAGVAIGVLLSIVLNLWMATHFQVGHIPFAYIGGGLVLLIVLGQGATFTPALRASRVSPVEATRAV